MTSPSESPNDIRNIVSNETKDDEQKPLKKLVNYQEKEINRYFTPYDFEISLRKACNDLYTKFSIGRWNKQQWCKLVSTFVKETVSRGMNWKVPKNNVAPFACRSMENKHDLKKGKVVKRKLNGVYYDWLNE